MEKTLAAVFAVLLASTFSTAFFAVQTTLHRKQGVPYFPGNFGRPYNILLHPDRLTAKGLLARRMCIGSFCIVVCSLFTGVVVAILSQR